MVQLPIYKLPEYFKILQIVHEAEKNSQIITTTDIAQKMNRTRNAIIQKLSNVIGTEVEYKWFSKTPILQEGNKQRGNPKQITPDWHGILENYVDIHLVEKEKRKPKQVKKIKRLLKKAESPVIDLLKQLVDAASNWRIEPAQEEAKTTVNIETLWDALTLALSGEKGEQWQYYHNNDFFADLVHEMKLINVLQPPTIMVEVAYAQGKDEHREK